MLQKKVNQGEKEYLEYLLVPLHEKYHSLKESFKDIKKEFKEIKDEFKEIKHEYKEILKQHKNYFLATIGLSLTLAGIGTARYMNLQTQIEEISNKTTARYEKQLEFNYNLMKKLDENQNQLKQLYDIHGKP